MSQRNKTTPKFILALICGQDAPLVYAQSAVFSGLDGYDAAARLLGTDGLWVEHSTVKMARSEPAYKRDLFAALQYQRCDIDQWFAECEELDAESMVKLAYLLKPCKKPLRVALNLLDSVQTAPACTVNDYEDVNVYDTGHGWIIVNVADFTG